MQEAFRRAVEESPNSPVVPKIIQANRVQAQERIKQRKEGQFAQLREQFKDLGLMWYGTRIDHLTGRLYRYNRIPIKKKGEQWLQALTSLNEKPSEKRIELLRALASGMQLTDEYVRRVYAQSILQIAYDNFLYFLRSKLLGVNFTPQSILFMEAISDMSGHSKEQKQEFKEFMVREAGLKGNVGLPQLFPGISRWLDHSKSQQPKHDL